ncbi:MAG TPA: DMT family transporter [Acidimicrobiales bacterium]|nr:DMT family transporter [Acidimicrobiales bacterium]
MTQTHSAGNSAADGGRKLVRSARRERALGLAAVCAGTALWGSAAPLGKSIDAPPLVLLVWRQIIALTVLVAFLALRRRPIRREDVRASRYAALMFGVHLIGFFGAARLTSVAVVLLIYALAPVLIIPIAALLLHERPTRFVVVLGVVAIVGVALVVTTGSSQGSNPTLGLVVSIGNLLLWVVWSLVIKGARMGRVDTATWMLCANIGAFIVVLTVALIMREDLGAIHGYDWLRVIALAVGPGLIGHGLNTWALGHVDVGLASVIGLGEPVLAALGAAIFLSEPLGAIQITGIAIVIAAVALVVARSTRAVPEPVALRLRA